MRFAHQAMSKQQRFMSLAQFDVAVNFCSIMSILMSDFAIQTQFFQSYICEFFVIFPEQLGKQKQMTTSSIYSLTWGSATF
jgi:hypothetical protein